MKIKGCTTKSITFDLIEDGQGFKYGSGYYIKAYARSTTGYNAVSLESGELEALPPETKVIPISSIILGGCTDD